MSAFEDHHFSRDHEPGQRKRDRDEVRSRRRTRSRSRDARRRRDDRRSRSRRRSNSKESRRRGERDFRRPRDSPHEPVAMITRTFVDDADDPISDWWCNLCTNPNMQARIECKRCGQLHVSNPAKTVPPSSDIMSDLIPMCFMPALRTAAVHGKLGVGGQRAACDYAEHGNDVTFLTDLVASVVSTVPECNRTLLHTVSVWAAAGDAPSAPPIEGALMHPGFVVCLSFCSLAQARQCLLSTSSKIAFPGLPNTGRRGATEGILRFGYSSRKPVPKPVAVHGRPLPVLDISEVLPESCPSWTPPVIDDLQALKEYLTGLFNDWDALLPQQREFYEANIGRVSQPVMATSAAAAGVQIVTSHATPQQQHVTSVTTAASESVAVAVSQVGACGSVPAAPTLGGLSDIKKRLEEKRLALERKKQEEAQAQGPTVVAAESETTPSGPNTGLSVLERLAQKKAQMLSRLSESGGTQAAAASSSSIGGDDSAVQQPKVIPLLHTLFPVPPAFPLRPHATPTTGTVNKAVQLKSALRLEGIPCEVAVRIFGSSSELGRAVAALQPNLATDSDPNS